MIPKSGNRFSDKIMRKTSMIPKSGNRFSDKIMRKTSMIPKSGNRFSDKIMRKAKNLSRNPIQLNRIEVQSDQSPGYLADVITAPQISPQA